MQIAAEYGGQIVNADAIQVFDGWHVLSARPSQEDEAEFPHRLYGHIPIDGKYSVGHWLRDIAPILVEKTRPIIVGGTGLYFSALTQGLAEIPATPSDVRKLADEIRAKDGFETMLTALNQNTLNRIDVNNPMRVQRAWEVLQSTGRNISDWQDATPPALLPLDKVTPIVFDVDKDWLTNRIDRRFDLMLEHGALDEARENLATWNPKNLSSKAIGAPELIDYLLGKQSIEQAREKATIATRQYAKRQRTWFRARMSDWIKWTPEI